MWFFYSLFFALWGAVNPILIKGFTKELNARPLLFVLNIFGLFFILVILILSNGFPNVTFNFFRYMFISAVLDTGAFLSFITAIGMSQVSLLAPLSSFGPVFTLIIAIFTLGEMPTAFKSLGVVLIVVGAYLLNVRDVKHGVLKPFENLINNKGALLYLLATMLWAITPIFQKKAIFETQPTVPLFASFVGIVFVTIFLLPFVTSQFRPIAEMARVNLKILVIFGLFTALSQLAAYTAFSQANVGYVTSIMRMTALFTVILGGKFLKEERIAERLLGASIMIAGALLIALKA